MSRLEKLWDELVPEGHFVCPKLVDVGQFIRRYVHIVGTRRIEPLPYCCRVVLCRCRRAVYRKDGLALWKCI